MSDIVERLKALDKPRSLADWENVGDVADEAAYEIERLRNKLNTDSQAFQIECQKAEIESLRSRLAEAEALLAECRAGAAYSEEDWRDWRDRTDTFLGDKL